MEPWQSWAAAICIGGAAFFYYAKDSKYFMKARDTATSTISDQLPNSTSRQRADKQSTRRKDKGQKTEHPPPSYAEAAASGASNAQGASSKKRKSGRTPTAPVPSATKTEPSVQADNDEGDETGYEDKEWAKQLAARKTGVSIDSNKSARQERVKGVAASGNDWDGQLPGAPSSSQRQANNMPNGTPAGGDVSDMLEPRAPGPSAIRISGAVEEQAKRNQSSRAAPAQETKKQRQNRKKAEEKKLQREEDEKQRQILLENQRRSAREARGEPAKNGMAAAKAPATNAWTPPAQAADSSNGPVQAPAPVKISTETQLLDTFDHDALSTSSSNDPATNSTTPATVSSTYDPDLPSEETQLEMLNEMNQNAGWNEVATKGKKSKKKNGAPTQTTEPLITSSGGDGNAYSAISTASLVNGSVSLTDTPKSVPTAKPAPTSVPKPKSQTNGFAALEEATAYTPGVKGHPDDSDWAVF